MRGSLAKARVLYIPVEEIGDEGRLLRACSILAFSVNVNFMCFWFFLTASSEVITDAFVKAGLVLEKDANQSLKVRRAFWVYYLWWDCCIHLANIYFEQLHATVMNARHRKRWFSIPTLDIMFRQKLMLQESWLSEERCVVSERRWIRLMQGRYINSLETKTGESIWSKKLIYHSVLCLTRAVITIAVLPYLFPENTETEKKH